MRSKLRAAAVKHEQLDVDTIGRDDCCEFGKWMHGLGGAQFGTPPSFVRLIAEHKKIHQEAANVANTGDGTRVEKLMDSCSAFSHATNEVSRLIVQLKAEIRGSAIRGSRMLGNIEFCRELLVVGLQLSSLT